MQKLQIHTEYIKLDQFIKWAGIVGQGSDAKVLIASGLVFVNGEAELRRGRKIRKGDVVSFEDKKFEVI